MFTTTNNSTLNEYAAAPAMYYRLRAILAADPDITMEYDHKSTTVNIIVAADDRAEALSEILPSEYEFKDGEVLHVLINGMTFEHSQDLDEDTIRLAFWENPYFVDVKRVESPMGGRDFVVFKNTTIAYKADNYGNPAGYYVKTAEQLAVSVFEFPGLFVTSDVGFED